MKTISFFSIKGGTGRSLALANVAAYFVTKGKRVGCVDFDIMAPGLLSIFKVPDEISQQKASVIDMLINLDNIELLTNSIIDCGEFIGLPKNYLFLIPAKTEPKKKYQELAKSDVFQVGTMNIFKTKFLHPFCGIKELDYLFIDARSGLAEESLCALSLAKKHIILFTRLDTQSINVTIHFIKLLNEYRYRLKPTIVAANVPSGDAEFVIDGNHFKINKQALEIIKKTNHALSNFNVQINSIIPFDETLLLEHKILTTTHPDNPTSKGFLLLAKIIENLEED
jgi:MinD-like ATPase involved in chromosome partitioning or flagellar assembly